MSDNNINDAVTIEITDPSTHEVFTFTGATEDEAQRKADDFFGVDEADNPTS
ncbi:hypothetical protein [Mycolicibacterium llatzerense]|uniref:hypothetical protein n=1 Tax=Mycolicibacterium llatzerense TaxID=280871 RepID=UPI0021B63279|nr:hypothetical protein [Mycolicibacterium llatzerense]